MNKIKVNSVIEIPRDYTGMVEYTYGTKYWYKEGKLHRVNGPAIENPTGDKYWYIEGKSYIEEIAIENKFYLGKEKGKYGIEWFRFLTEEGIEEYPILPGLSYRYYTTSIDDLR